MSAQSGSASGSRPLAPDEYDSLIERLRETADSVIPRNATVLVVSRGDDELIQLGPRRGLHFPQDEFGSYPGYHPEDSEAAIAILENMRDRGGEYFLLPSTSFWWLDYYEGFRDHLETKYSSVMAGDDCMIFDLTPSGVQTAASNADTGTMSAATSRRLGEPLDELLRALLPADARIAVVTAGDATLPSFSDSVAVQAPGGAGDAQFLVVPAREDAPIDGDAGGFDGWQLVTRQRYLADVYERSPIAVRRSPENGQEQSAHGARPPADQSFWHRLKDLFRR